MDGYFLAVIVPLLILVVFGGVMWLLNELERK